MIKTLITPEEISMLARPCYADEEKALAYIVEAEQNNIKPAIGDDLFIQLKEGGQTFLLEGGVYERNGKRYELNGIKKALAYFVISRMYESSTTELTRQGVVNRRSEYSDNADERDIISVSRETYAIANRYMEEVEKYLGINVKNTSQRVRFDLVGGGSNTHRQCRPSSSSSGGASPSSPSVNINVVHVLGDSDKDVISQAGVTMEFNAVREEADEKLAEAKAYTDEKFNNIDIPQLPTLAEVAETGDYNDLENKPNIPTKLSELENDTNFAEGMNVIVVSDLLNYENAVYDEDSNGVLVGINGNERLIIPTIVDVDILGFWTVSDNNVTFEVVFTTGDNVPEILFDDIIKWAKEPVFNPNKTYAVTIEGNNVNGEMEYLAMYAEFDYLNTEEV